VNVPSGIITLLPFFSVGEIKMAAECTGTYLLLKPNDATMVHNYDYYARQFGILPDDFKPRKVEYSPTRYSFLSVITTIRCFSHPSMVGYIL